MMMIIIDKKLFISFVMQEEYFHAELKITCDFA